MNVKIQARGFELTEALQEYAQRRVDFALSWYRAEIQSLEIRLSDVNGPKGGRDKRCAIQLRLRGEPSLRVDDVETNMYAAIDRAVDRCKRTLARRVARLRDHSVARSSEARL